MPFRFSSTTLVVALLLILGGAQSIPDADSEYFAVTTAAASIPTPTTLSGWIFAAVKSQMPNPGATAAPNVKIRTETDSSSYDWTYEFAFIESNGPQYVTWWSNLTAAQQATALQATRVETLQDAKKRVALSNAEIGGIVAVFVLILIGAVGAGSFFLYRKRRTRRSALQESLTSREAPRDVGYGPDETRSFGTLV